MEKWLKKQKSKSTYLFPQLAKSYNKYVGGRSPAHVFSNFLSSIGIETCITKENGLKQSVLGSIHFGHPMRLLSVRLV